MVYFNNSDFVVVTGSCYTCTTDFKFLTDIAFFCCVKWGVFDGILKFGKIHFSLERVKNIRFLWLIFFAVQKRPIEWRVPTSSVFHFHRRARLSEVMTKHGGRTQFCYFVENNKLRVVTCRSDRDDYSAISAWAWVYSSGEEAEEEIVEEEVSQCQSSSIASRRLDSSWCVCERYTVMPSEVECGSPFGRFLIRGLYPTLSVLF